MNEVITQILREEERWGGRFLLLPHVESDVRDMESKERSLEEVRLSLSTCRRCVLGGSRKNIVFGEGSINAQVMFIGEAPGAVEDDTGRPFVGPAGKLLTDIIEKGMGLKRSDVYIANILKCRPPENRDPNPAEITECIGNLREQIGIIQPRVMVVLGKIAAQTLLDTDAPISGLRGRFQDYQGICVMPTYHPSYLLHNPAKKRDVWEDIKKVMQYLDLPLPK